MSPLHRVDDPAEVLRRSLAAMTARGMTIWTKGVIVDGEAVCAIAGVHPEHSHAKRIEDAHLAVLPPHGEGLDAEWRWGACLLHENLAPKHREAWVTLDYRVPALDLGVLLGFNAAYDRPLLEQAMRSAVFVWTTRLDADMADFEVVRTLPSLIVNPDELGPVLRRCSEHLRGRPRAPERQLRLVRARSPHARASQRGPRQHRRGPRR